MKRAWTTLALSAFLLGLNGCETVPQGPDQATADASPASILEDQTETPQQQLAEAQAATDAGNYDTALGMLREILAQNPTLTPAYVGIGDIFLLKKDYANAEPAYARAARLEPRNFSAQYGHGVALRMLKRFAEAVKSFYRALTIEPADVKANLAMATTRLEMGEPGGALIFAAKAVELDPANGPARVNLGVAYDQTGRYADAIVQYEAAIELMEPAAPLLLNYINVLAKEKRYLDAKNTAEYLIRIEPTANGYERLGWAHFRLGEFGKSIDAYRKAVELEPSHWQSHNGVGCNALNTWLISKKRDQQAAKEAKASFRHSLQIHPNQPKVVQVLTNYRL